MDSYTTDINKILEEERNRLADTKKSQKEAVDKIHDSKASALKLSYESAQDDIKKAYTGEYQKNAVQRLINEKQVAESMENLGLTNSGLNRTQQTAVQMGYSNNKATIDRNRQATLDNISQKMAEALAEIEQSRITSHASVDAKIEELANTNALNIYNTNVAANEAQNSYTNATTPVSTATATPQTKDDEDFEWWDFAGYDKSTGKAIYYNSKGNKKLVDKGVNPINGKVNQDYFKNSFKWDNGHQPDNIEGIRLSPTSETFRIHGRDVKIWELKTDAGVTKWIWDAALNQYREVVTDDGVYQTKG